MPPPLSDVHRRAALALAPVRIQVGPCMAGLLKDGDEAVLEPCPWSRLRIGDLVALQTQDGSTVLHRFFGARRACGGIRLLTKGDRAPAFDKALPPEALLGRVSGVWRDGNLLRRSRGLPLKELPALALSLSRGLASLARRRLESSPS